MSYVGSTIRHNAVVFVGHLLSLFIRTELSFEFCVVGTEEELCSLLTFIVRVIRLTEMIFFIYKKNFTRHRISSSDSSWFI